METLFRNTDGVDVKLQNDQLVEISGVVFKVTSIQNEPIKKIGLEPANADGIAEYKKGRVNAPKLNEKNQGNAIKQGDAFEDDLAKPSDKNYPNETNRQRDERNRNVSEQHRRGNPNHEDNPSYANGPGDNPNNIGQPAHSGNPNETNAQRADRERNKRNA